MKLILIFYIDNAMFVCAGVSVEGLEECRHTCFNVAQVYKPRSHIKMCNLHCLVADFDQEMVRTSIKMSLEQTHTFDSVSEHCSGKFKWAAISMSVIGI